MANLVTIEPTEFTNPHTATVTYGFRLYDDYGAQYANGWESIPGDGMAVLERVVSMWKSGELKEEIVGLLEFVEEHEKGLYVSQTWYDWDQIKHLFGWLIE